MGQLVKLKQNDTLPILERVLLDPDGNPHDLAGSTGWKLHIFLADGVTKLTRDMALAAPRSITNATVASPTVLTSPNHRLVTGDIVTISGATTTPSINGEHPVTVIDKNTFTVPVAVSVGGAQTASAEVKGMVAYAWVAGDWGAGQLVPGPTIPLKVGEREHWMEYEVLGSGAARLTFPNDGYDILRITADIGQG